MPPKQHIIPMITYGAGLWPMEGTTGSKSRHHGRPDKCPDNHPGTENSPRTARTD